MSTFYIRNEKTGEFAAQDSEGEHDGKTADTLSGARSFPTAGAAADFSQNFGPDWFVVDESFP